MLSLHVNSPVPNTLFAPKLNPSRSQTRITPPFSLRKVRARGSSAEVAVKENEQQRRRRSNERISDLSLEEEELPAGLNREANDCFYHSLLLNFKTTVAKERTIVFITTQLHSTTMISFHFAATLD